jgi:signal peptide peptidase SppA
MKKLFAVACLALGLALAPYARAEKPDLLEVIDLSGEVNASMAAQVTAAVEAINDSQKVKAVLLIVDTPGGGVTASSAIYEELSKLKMPVVGWCNNLCASGGMYILMSPRVKYVGLRSQTIAGSIGVVLSITRFNRLLDWMKIDNETYVSGALKDAGNPTRAAKDDERKYLQEINDTLAARFYEIVGKSRKITDWAQVKSARIFIGQEAVKVGLADAVMSKAEAIRKAKELSGSKTIFTREELKKMSHAADENAVYQLPLPLPQFGDLPWLIELAKEVRSGESVKFEYRLPLTF